jgi:hypothetical protein
VGDSPGAEPARRRGAGARERGRAAPLEAEAGSPAAARRTASERRAREQGEGLSVGPVDDRRTQADAVAGFLAAAAIAAGLLSILYKPARIGPVALVIALIAVGIGGRNERLATWAVATVTVGWVLGMIVAVITENPVY